MRTGRGAWAVSLLILLAIAASARVESPAALTVFAASSLTPPLERLAAAAIAASGLPVRFSFASTATLARQIDAGAGADVIITADDIWMKYLADRARIVPGTRTAILGNRLALVVPADRPASVTIGPGLRLDTLLGRGRLAIGDPDHVPAGTYAREALTTLGIWQTVSRSLATADSARMALALVERGEAPAGIVFESDAAQSAKVIVAGLFPETSHRPIVYEAAIVAGRETAAARAFLAFLRSKAARDVFTAGRFTVR